MCLYIFFTKCFWLFFLGFKKFYLLMGITPTPTPPSWLSMDATKDHSSTSGLYISTWNAKMVNLLIRQIARISNFFAKHFVLTRFSQWKYFIKLNFELRRKTLRFHEIFRRKKNSPNRSEFRIFSKTLRFDHLWIWRDFSNANKFVKLGKLGTF